EPAGDVDFARSIGALLAAAPERGIDDGSPISFYYADLAGQLASTGIERPDPSAPPAELPPGFAEVTLALPLASRPFMTGLDPEWFSTFGFDPFAIGQSLDLFNRPNVVSIIAGGFDPERVERALEESGYQLVLQETGGPYWTVGDEPAFDTPVGRLGGGQMNHMMVSEELLVFSQLEEDVRAVTQVLAGYAPSMSEQNLWTEMVPEFSPDTVGLVPVSPSILQPASSFASPVASPVPVYDSIGIEHLVFGVRSGSRSAPLALVGEGTPEPKPASGTDSVPARIEVRIWYGSEENAEREAESIPVRWAETSSDITGQPYSELMEIEDTRVSERNPRVAAIDFVTDVPNRWTQLIHSADLAPLAPPPPVG
ncbi:MAG TPA: hypothetical protein VD789_00590, partial [Thermomicrobiales bacterium]|nr:hypothetical protein [Thermomicrobiales bacterium]